jgi:hypothetical protein
MPAPLVSSNLVRPTVLGHSWRLDLKNWTLVILTQPMRQGLMYSGMEYRSEGIRTSGATRIYLAGIRPHFGALFGTNKRVELKRICSPGFVSTSALFGSFRSSS